MVKRTLYCEICGSSHGEDCCVETAKKSCVARTPLSEKDFHRYVQMILDMCASVLLFNLSRKTFISNLKTVLKQLEA